MSGSLEKAKKYCERRTIQEVSMRYRCAYQATGKWGRMASTPPCRNRHRPPPKCRSRPQRRRSPRRPRMIDRCSVRVGDTQLSIYLSVYLTIYLVRAARSQRRLAACVEYKVAQASASWLCGGSSQRHRGQRVQSLFEPNTANRPRKPYKPGQIMPQVAPSFAATASASRPLGPRWTAIQALPFT